MTPLTQDQKKSLKTIILDYLQGTPNSVTQVCLQTQCAEFETSCKNLYQMVGVDANDDDFLIAILGSLNITPSQGEAGTYEKLLRKSGNFYELLIHLSHDGHHHVTYLLNLIENTKPKKNWTLILLAASILTAGVGTFFHFQKPYFEALANWFNRTFPFVVNWFGKTFSLLRNIPILGIVTNSLLLSWSWYRTFSNGTTSTAHKLKSLLFKSLTGGLTIAAYALSYVANGAMMTASAVLFVLSSSIDIIESLYGWYQNNQLMRHTKRPQGDRASWKACAEYERLRQGNQASKQSLWVKLSAASLTMIAVGIWSFFPPSLLLTLSCIAFISLVSLTKKAFISHCNDMLAENLQTNLRHLTIEKESELTPSQRILSVQLQREKTALEAREAALAETQSSLEAEAVRLSDKARQLEEKSNTMTQTLNVVRQGLHSIFQPIPRHQTAQGSLSCANECLFGVDEACSSIGSEDDALTFEGGLGI